MNAIKLITMSQPDGTVSFRLPELGRFRVHVEVTWESASIEREALVAELMRQANPDVLQILQDRGENSLPNLEVLRFYGALADDPIERPEQPPLETREQLR